MSRCGSIPVSAEGIEQSRCDELNKYAEELSNARGKGEKDRIKRAFLERLRETIDELFTGAEGRGVERGGRNAKAGVVAGAGGVKIG